MTDKTAQMWRDLPDPSLLAYVISTNKFPIHMSQLI